MIYVANISEGDIINPDNNKEYVRLKEQAKIEGCAIIPVCANIEADVAMIEDKDERSMFLEEFGIKESGLDKLIKTAYDILGLETFLTGGPDECRAWTFKKGMTAPQCAGVIHTDFERGFIKAEVYHYEDIHKYRTEAAIKEAGKYRIEGKDYVMKDGDVVFFRFNV